MHRTYLDHNASSPLRPEARAAMIAAMDACGNPSSIHAEGRGAQAIVERARESIAAVLDAPPPNVFFTSGGTEAAAAALALAQRYLLKFHESVRTVVTATEHICVLKNAPENAVLLSVDGQGVVDIAAMMAEVEKGSCVLVMQDANNETGVMQPALIETRLHEAGAVQVCDMAQTAGRVRSRMHGHIAFISAHKFGGPKGVGAVAWGTDFDAPVAPMIRGGGQERGHRAGTENVAAIAGMAAALEAGEADRERFAAWAASAQRRLEDGLRAIAPDAVIFGEGAPRLPNTTCFAAPGVPAEIALMALDLEGVAVSSGSACSSGKVAPSHVLAAMGVAPDLAKCAIRVSTGWNSTDADIDRFLDVWGKIYGRLRPRAAA